MLRRVLGLLGIVVVLAVTAIIWRAWEPDRSVESLRERWAKPPSQFVDVEGLRVHVRDVGPRDDATPIVLLHGTSASLHTWEPWVAALSSSRRVVTLDLPGFGLTGATADGDVSIDQTLRVLHTLFARLDVKRIILAGNSYGGRIAWEYAVAHQDQVAGLVLVDSSGYPLQSKSVPIGFRIARTPGLRRLAEKLLPRSIIENSVRNVYVDQSKVTPEVVDRYFELTLREGNRVALARRFEQVPLAGDVEKLKSLRMPTLILWGEEDRLIPLENGKKFDADIPNSELVVFPNVGHVPQEEAPEVSVAALQKWLGTVN